MDATEDLLNVPTKCRVHDLLAAAAKRAPESVAVGNELEHLAYQRVCTEIDAYAKGLLALGVKRGDRVAMLTPPSIDFWIAFHATVSIGGIWLGINPRYQRRDFGHLLADSDPSVILAVSPFDDRDYCQELSTLAKAGIPIISHGDATAGANPLSQFLKDGKTISDAALASARRTVDPEDAAIIVYTSGTTGKPKGAMLSHRAIVSSAVVNARWMGHDALKVCVCAAPVNHVGAINNICMNVLAGCGAVIFYPRVDIPALAALSKKEKPTYLVSSPTGFSMMLSQPNAVGTRLAHTQLIVFGGAATPRSVLELVAPGGARLSSVYGQTETCGIITHTDETTDLEVLSATIGKVLPGADLRVAGPDGSELPVGETGEIQIRGPYVMSGYFRNPEATREAFTADGFLKTGDLGLIRADGNLVFVGRLKEMFKSGGYNIYPVEIEQAISEHPAVSLVAVLPMNHPTFQEVGHAFVQPRPHSEVTAGELRDFLRDRIANYKIPKVFTIDAELPTLPNGKVDKMALRSRISS